MEVQKRGSIKIIPNHTLDKREYKDYTKPPSRASLTSYALEYGGALRMIRVSIFSNDLMTRDKPRDGRGWYIKAGASNMSSWIKPT